ADARQHRADVTRSDEADRPVREAPRTADDERRGAPWAGLAKSELPRGPRELGGEPRVDFAGHRRVGPRAQDFAISHEQDELVEVERLHLLRHELRDAETPIFEVRA